MVYLPHGLCWPLFEWARLMGCFSSFELWLCLFGKLSAQARSVELNVLIPVVRCLCFHNTKHLGALSTSSRPYRLCLCPLSFIPQDQASPFVHARRGVFILWFSCHLVSHGGLRFPPLSRSSIRPSSGFLSLTQFLPIQDGCWPEAWVLLSPMFSSLFIFPSFWFYIALPYFDDSSWYLSYFCNSYFMRVL